MRRRSRPVRHGRAPTPHTRPQTDLPLKRASLASDRLRNVPLHAAAFSDNVSIARCLLAAKAEVDPRDAAGNTPLHRATLEGNHEVAELLLSHGAFANAAGSEQNSPLHFLALGAPEEPELVAGLLLRHGAAPLQTNRFRRTPIDLARFHGQPRLVRRPLPAWLGLRARVLTRTRTLTRTRWSRIAS